MIPAEARDAWRDLESRLRPFVAKRVRSKADVDDVLQDVFLRMQRGLPGLRDDERFGPWVYRVARSAIVDAHRRSPRSMQGAEEHDEEHPIDAVHDADASNRMLASVVRDFVDALPSPYREALTLTELDGLTQSEAAAIAGISLSGMKSRVQRGRERLRIALERCCDIALDVRGGVLACVPRHANECRCDVAV